MGNISFNLYLTKILKKQSIINDTENKKIFNNGIFFVKSDNIE